MKREVKVISLQEHAEWKRKELAREFRAMSDDLVETKEEQNGK